MSWSNLIPKQNGGNCQFAESLTGIESRKAVICYLGYRVSKKEGEGAWIARWRDEDGKQHYRSLGPRTGFDDARKEALLWFRHAERTDAADYMTVGECCQHYVRELRARGREKAAIDNEGRFAVHIQEPFAGIRMDKLRAKHIKQWRDGLDVAPNTAIRIMSCVYAAFNLAFKENLIGDKPWQAVSKPKGETNRRDRWLTLEERQSLLANCAADLRAFVKGLMLTAARPGELAACTVKCLDRKAGTLHYPTGKTGGRVVTLTSDMLSLCLEQAHGKLPTAPLFSRADGSQWDKLKWERPFKLAAKHLGSDVVLYSIRHTAISEMLVAGIDASTVARFAGTSTAMIDKHYHHLIHTKVRSKMEGVVLV